MDIEKEIKLKFADKIISLKETEKGKIYIDINPAYVKFFAESFFNDFGLRFITATGTDTRKYIEIMYHFSDDSSDKIFSLRAFIYDKKNPAIDSISNILRAAEWIEREIHELLGVNFIGHKNLRHLLLSDD
ncbi:MAG: NADH-quinone oxidoreductase subunit C [Elusimicrobia bacterium]|nr:NADH-quinone oxidoreductase subunit C [Elusimicrobiota bacterium]